MGRLAVGRPARRRPRHPRRVVAPVLGTPGGFAVPLILLGLLLSHMARTNQEVPRYTGWVLAAWVALAAWILEPSGFPLGLIPAALLILAPHHQSSPEPGTT
ncbi:DUF6463 family protein [Streptomyces sp. NBC_00193]|uniref:DUF6463 family protein n=1 Tax=unclassified Streptomyces TaxID=2593676 RepID=UPI00338F1912